MEHRAFVVVALLASLAGSGACDGPEPIQAPPPESKSDELDPQTEARLAERKAKREAEQKAKAEAEAKLGTEIERLCVVPDAVPRDFVEACDAVGKAHDEYVRRSGDADAIAAWDNGGSEREIPMTVVQCAQASSAPVAACQKNALDGLGPEMKDHVKDFLQACIDKFAGPRRGPAALVPKRRPG